MFSCSAGVAIGLSSGTGLGAGVGFLFGGAGGFPPGLGVGLGFGPGVGDAIMKRYDGVGLGDGVGTGVGIGELSSVAVTMGNAGPVPCASPLPQMTNPHAISSRMARGERHFITSPSRTDCLLPSRAC